jgi:hydroxymethylbilane synthase
VCCVSNLPEMSTPKTIRIAARSSVLSQIQAHAVANSIRAACPEVAVQFHWRVSHGDIDRVTALAAFGGKGIFTEDLTALLIKGEADVVVHSWKDLPVEMHPATKIGATLKRADMRDLLLVKKEVAADLSRLSELSILSSSPRRERNLRRFLPEALPRFKGTPSFSSVRGNVPTRLRKLLEGKEGGLVVAKAALDRLLLAEAPDFQDSRQYVREVLSGCCFMVLPLRENPCAPAQGALAIEMARSRDDLEEILAKVHSADTAECCERERAILASYGGGCHQKIGVAVLKRPFGRITFIQGETDAGKDLEALEFERLGAGPQKISAEKAWPLKTGERGEREDIAAAQPPSDMCLWVVKDRALPAAWQVGGDQVVWTSGLRTWKKLASRGVWVSGSSEGLGESEDPFIDLLLGRKSSWLKLTHQDGAPFPWGNKLATYRRKFNQPLPDLSKKTHFFWRSGSDFLQALKEYPGIASAHHSSGPGSTALLLKEKVGDAARVSVFLDYEEWLKELGLKEAAKR